MRSLAMASWLGTMLLAAPAVAEDCADWNSERFFANVTVEEVVGCLHAGADANAQDEGGVTPLHLAARFNPSDAVIRALIDAGANLNLRDKTGRAPLHLAAWQMHLAARYNTNPAVLAVLLAAGADPDAQGESDATPLHCGRPGTTAFRRFSPS